MVYQWESSITLNKSFAIVPVIPLIRFAEHVNKFLKKVTYLSDKSAFLKKM